MAPLVAAPLAVGGDLLSAAAAQADVGYDNFKSCNNSPYEGYVLFPDRGGFTSVGIAPWTCWTFDASGMAWTSGEAVGYGYIDGSWDVVGTEWYNPQAWWTQFNLNDVYS